MTPDPQPERRVRERRRGSVDWNQRIDEALARNLGPHAPTLTLPPVNDVVEWVAKNRPDLIREAFPARRSDPTGAVIGLGCAALGGAIVGGIVMWLLAWAVFSATPRPAADVVPPLTGAPQGVLAREATGALVGSYGRDVTSPALAADGASASATSVVSTSTIGTPEESTSDFSGVLKWASRSHGASYLAIRASRGTWAIVCGAADCTTMRSTDVGPKGPEAIADVALDVWTGLCGKAPSAGVCRGTVTLLHGPQPSLPPTDTGG